MQTLTLTHKPLDAAQLEELRAELFGGDPDERLDGDTMARILASVCAERERADEAEKFLRKMFDSADAEGRNILTSNVLRCLTREHQVSLCTHVLGDEHRELKGRLDARDAEVAYLRRQDVPDRLAALEAERERADATATELAALKAAMRDVNVFNSDDVQYLRDLASDVNRDDSQRKGAALLLAVMEETTHES